MKILKEIGRETYGHDNRAINKHAERTYRDQAGKRYVLSRTLDGCPPFFEAYGPFQASFQGVLPRLRIKGKDCWGAGWTWGKAIKAFLTEIVAEMRKRGGNHV